MKKLLSVILCLCILFTGAPLVAIAADGTVKIVSVKANTSQTYDRNEIEVTFTDSADPETLNHFTAELCYTYNANGHPYTVRRRDGYGRKNDDGTYTLTMPTPFSLTDDAFLKPTLSIVRFDTDGTETVTKPVPLTAAPEMRFYCSPLKVTVGDTTYTYGPGADETVAGTAGPIPRYPSEKKKTGA